MPINVTSCRPAGRCPSKGAGRRKCRTPFSRLICIPFAALTALSACGSNPMGAQPASCSAVEGQLYARGVHGTITRNWLPPVDVEIACTVLIRQRTDGTIDGVEIADCNDDSAVRRSVSAAVHESSPLPLPANMACFDRDIRLVFQYNPANRR